MKVDEGRRKFCIAGLTGISGVLGASVLGSGAVFLGAPGISNKLEGKWIEAGALADFEEGLFSRVVLEYEVQDGWAYSNQKMLAFVRRHGDKLLALSATCTHLGCNVRWREESNQFVCPCHAGVYDENGRWTVMMQRELKTDSDTDVKINPKKDYSFGIAVFDNSGRHHSYNSPPLKLKF